MTVDDRAGRSLRHGDALADRDGVLRAGGRSDPFHRERLAAASPPAFAKVPVSGSPVLVVRPGRRQRVDPNLVAATLGLTPAESQVAVRLAAGESVREMAAATGHTTGAIDWHLKRICREPLSSRHADRLRLALPTAACG